MWMGVNLLEWYDKNIEELVIYEDDTVDEIVRKVTEKVFEIEQKYFGLTHEEIIVKYSHYNCMVFADILKRVLELAGKKIQIKKMNVSRGQEGSSIDDHRMVYDRDSMEKKGSSPFREPIAYYDISGKYSAEDVEQYLAFEYSPENGERVGEIKSNMRTSKGEGVFGVSPTEAFFIEPSKVRFVGPKAEKTEQEEEQYQLSIKRLDLEKLPALDIDFEDTPQQAVYKVIKKIRELEFAQGVSEEEFEAKLRTPEGSKYLMSIVCRALSAHGKSQGVELYCTKSAECPNGAHYGIKITTPDGEEVVDVNGSRPRDVFDEESIIIAQNRREIDTFDTVDDIKFVGKYFSREMRLGMERRRYKS